MNYNKAKIYSLQGVPLKLQTYAAEKDFARKAGQVFVYRLIFLGFGVLFTFLAATIMKQNPHWSYVTLFGSGYGLKNFLTLLSFTFAISSLWIGCKIRTGHELVRSYARRAYLKAPKTAEAFKLIETDCTLTIKQLDELEASSFTKSQKQQKKLDILSHLKLRLLAQ